MPSQEDKMWAAILAAHDERMSGSQAGAEAQRDGSKPRKGAATPPKR